MYISSDTKNAIGLSAIIIVVVIIVFPQLSSLLIGLFEYEAPALTFSPASISSDSICLSIKAKDNLALRGVDVFINNNLVDEIDNGYFTFRSEINERVTIPIQLEGDTLFVAMIAHDRGIAKTKKEHTIIIPSKSRNLMKSVSNNTRKINKKNRIKIIMDGKDLVITQHI